MDEKKQLEELKRRAALESEEAKSKQSPNTGLELSVIPKEQEETNSIIQDYKAAFGGKPGYKEPVVDEKGRIILSFPQIGDAEQFFLDQAQKGVNIVIVDLKTNQVMAYSCGDGKLYHGDGKEFQQGDSLKPSGISFDNFELPSPGSTSHP